MNANVATNVGESLVDDVPDDDNGWHFKGAVGLDEVECVGVRRRFRDLQKSCRVQRQKVSDTIPEAVELADKLVMQVGESVAQAESDAAPETLLPVENEVLSLSANLKRSREEAVSAKAEIGALCAAAELATKQHNFALARVREERQDEFRVWKASTLWIEVTIAKVSEETSIDMRKLRSESNSTVTRHHELLTSIRRVVKAREVREDKAADTLVKLPKFYDGGRKVTMKAYVGKWFRLREPVAFLSNDLESKSLETQTMAGLVTEATRL